jgi:tetratricopeptide (TPR) repeat protein
LIEIGAAMSIHKSCFYWVVLVLLVPTLVQAQAKKESDDPFGDAASAMEKRNYDLAIKKYTKAIARTYRARSVARERNGDLNGAIADSSEAIRLDPMDAIAYYDRAVVYEQKADSKNAITDFSQAIRLDPQFMFAYVNRASIYQRAADYDKALADYRRALQIDPENWVPNYNLAWLLATCPKEGIRNGPQAVKLARKACELNGWKDPRRIDTLAAAYAEVGNFKEAMKWSKAAVELAKDLPKEKVEEFRARLKLYEQGKPCRDKPEATHR